VNPFLARCAPYSIITHPFPANSTRIFTRVLHLTYAHFAIHYLCLAYIHPKSLLLQSCHPFCESLLQLKPRLRQRYQVICIKELPWQAFFEIVSYGLHYYVKQEWATYRPLMYPNLDLKTFTLFTISFARCRNSLIQTFDHIYHPLFHSSTPQGPPQNLMRHSIEGLLQVYKSHPQLLLFAKKLFLNLPYNKNCIRCTFTRAKSKLHIIYLYSLSKSRLENSFQHL